MEDSYYDSTVEFLQSSLEIVSDNLAYGYETINNLVKEYDFIKFPMAQAAEPVGCGGCGGGGGGGGGKT
ncbi:MAG: hypothetical protein O3C05_02215 [Proteobacteria bacterium]|nr:hypothetical protein [Pseudomonadota bacterium]